jgi:hypothetical protein
MAMAFQWQTHPDISPFVALGASLQSRVGYPGVLDPRAATRADSASRAPDNMQVDSSGARPGAAGSSQPGSSAEGAAASGAEAGPSGAQLAAGYDAPMDEAPARKPKRKHSDAPMRKLSVGLIDTYKLINQVRDVPHPVCVRAGGSGRGAVGRGVPQRAPHAAQTHAPLPPPPAGRARVRAPTPQP